MTTKEIQDHWKRTAEAVNKNPKLLQNKMWRMENLYTIIDMKGNKEIFKLNRPQKHYVANRKHKNILLKSRQLGFTTLITLWNLDNILFKDNTEALAIAHTKEGMTLIFDKKVRFAIANLPEDMKKELWKFEQNSRTKIQVKVEDNSISSFGVSLSGRSGTYQHVHVSEFAPLCVMFPQRAEEVITGTFPAVPMDGEIDIESTGEGAYGRFYDMFIEAQKSLVFFNDSLSRVQFYPHFYNWTWDDKELDDIIDFIPMEKMERNDEIDWYSVQQEHNFTPREMTYYYRKWVYLNKNTEKLQQQFPCTWEEAFIASGRPYFNAKRVSEMMIKQIEPTRYEVIGPAVQQISNGYFSVYRKPQKNFQYVIGADTAEGLATGDKSTMCIINTTTREIDAIYQNTIEPFDFSDHLLVIGRWYNNALIAVESNKDGYWVNDNLQRSNYQNLYFRETIDDITKAVSKQFGWLTGKPTRDPMLTELKLQFMKRNMPFYPLLEEMMTFIRNKRNRPEAASGKHDDVIMATAIAYSVLKQKFQVIEIQNTPAQDYMTTIFGK